MRLINPNAASLQGLSNAIKLRKNITFINIE